MKCPYNDCQKDYNEAWNCKVSVIPALGHVRTTEANVGNVDKDMLQIFTRRCEFCLNYFHEIYAVNCKKEDRYPGVNIVVNEEELICTWPTPDTKFRAKNIPEDFILSFREAEKCFSVGSLVGSGACLRKAIYIICDDQNSPGRDYKEKISNLSLKKTEYKDLLKQIKWLGDNVSKPNSRSYTIDNIKLSFEVLPIIVDDLYYEDEKIQSAQKLLAKIRSKSYQSEV